MQALAKSIAVIGLLLTLLVGWGWQSYDGAAEPTKNRIIILSMFFAGVTLVGLWCIRNPSELFRIVQWALVIVLTFMVVRVVFLWQFYETAVDDERSRIATISIVLPLELLAGLWLATKNDSVQKNDVASSTKWPTPEA